MSNLVNVPTQDVKGCDFEHLYKVYWKILHQRFFGKLKDFHIAEDLAQETMLRVLQYWRKIEPGKESSIVSLMASAVYVDYLRREAGRSNLTTFIDDVLELEIILIPSDNFLETLDREYEQEQLELQLKDSLGSDLFYLFEEVYYKGRTVKELAIELDVSVNTLYWRMSQVREIAAEVYKGTEEG